MLSWAQQRKLVFLGWAVLTVCAAVGLYALISYTKGPSCTDGEKNGNERGVDCGGKCPRVCKADTSPLLVHFVRTFEVEEGVFAAVAYGENRNAGAGARKVPYLFKLYDEKNLLVYERGGTAFIPPRKVFAVFEGRMETGSRTPVRATFEFLQEPIFERMQEPGLILTTKDFTSDRHGSRLLSVIHNPSRSLVQGIEATALLYGSDGNLTGASATVLKKLPGEASANLIFTWPKELETPERIEVLYTVTGTN